MTLLLMLLLLLLLERRLQMLLQIVCRKVEANHQLGNLVEPLLNMLQRDQSCTQEELLQHSLSAGTVFAPAVYQRCSGGGG